MITAIAFAAAAGAAALVRVHLGRLGWIGTLAANLVGAFLLGWLVATGPSDEFAVVAGIGFCGALTTMSTFALEATAASRRHLAVVVATTIAGGLLAVSLGGALG